MATRNSAVARRIMAQLARDLDDPSKQPKAALIEAAAKAVDRSVSTVHRWVREYRLDTPRKRRADAGKTSVTRDEAIAISGFLQASMRKNNKRLMTVARALAILRENGLVRCERVDAATGEVQPLSADAVERALLIYKMHPRQLLRPTPTNRMRTLHPNHLWQIDASLCVLYYLGNGTRIDSGLTPLDVDKYYKNKPAALERVASERVWRYVVTDHYSGSIFAHYVMGAESARNMAESFIAAIQPRTVNGQRDPFCGVPKMIYMDRGAANTSGVARNLFRRLDVRPEAHMPGAPWATGQVEKAQDIVERDFESRLAFMPVRDLDELNELAALWSRHFNATEIHSRHGKTRTDVWLTITPEQMRNAPPVALCRELMTHAPETRRVSAHLTVSFGGHEYRVGDIAGLQVHPGATVLVTHSVYETDAVRIVDVDAEGHEVLYSAPMVEFDAAGFDVSAPVMGESYRARPQTVLQAHQREIDRYVYDADNDKAVAQKKKRRALPFGGRVDPMREAREAQLPIAITRPGTDLVPTAMPAEAIVAPPRTLTHFEAGRALQELGVSMTPERYGLLRQWHPEGVPETDLPDLQNRLSVRAGMRVIDGGAAVNH